MWAEMEKVEKLKKKGLVPWRSWRVAWLPHNPPSLQIGMQLRKPCGCIRHLRRRCTPRVGSELGSEGQRRSHREQRVSSAMRRQIAILPPISHPIWSRNHTGTNEARSSSHPKCQVQRGPSRFLPSVACISSPTGVPILGETMQSWPSIPGCGPRRSMRGLHARHSCLVNNRGERGEPHGWPWPTLVPPRGADELQGPGTKRVDDAHMSSIHD